MSAIAGSQSAWTPGELLGKTAPSTSVSRLNETGSPILGAPAAIEHAQVHAASQAAEDLLHLGEHEVRLRHVLRSQRLRQAGGGRKLADVVVRRLCTVAERQLAVQEELGCAATHLHQFGGGERLECLPRLTDAVQVARDQSGVGLAYLGNGLAVCGCPSAGPC